jgi:3-dehydroquinate dehydratase / shikimate dehydrogenase
VAQVCETVTGGSLDELRRARDAATGADLIELRLDGVRDPDVAGALSGRRRPVIVTCRARTDGGCFDGSEGERLELLGRAVTLGAEYVDVEWRAQAALLRSERTRLVISHHDFDGIPADLADRVRAMRGVAGPADVVKIAVMAERLTDCLRLRDAMANAGRHVAIAMGAAGQLSRVWPAGFSSAWTYGGSAAPGQIPAQDLVDIYRVRQVTSASAVYAVGGSPLAHSASPAMHNAAFRAAGIDAVYVPLETDDAGELLSVAGAIDVRGASITAPLKQTLATRIAVVTGLASELGALNTLKRTDGGWEGDNFDPAGFLEPLDRHGSLRGWRAVVLGAGGAARAAAWALRVHGVAVEICARRKEQAAAAARDLGVRAVSWPPEAGWDLLVNATPVGTWPAVDESPLPSARLRGRLVYDLVYNPAETALMRQAREAGIDAIGGLEMLVGQACRQFEWWMDRPAPVADIGRAAGDWVGRRR